MQRRAFGKTDLLVSELGLGCARIGGVFQGDALVFVRLLAVAREAGINFFDTADMYSQGESEALLGRVFRAHRSEVTIATKAGYCLPGRRKLAGRLKPFLKPVIKALGIKRENLPAATRGVIAQDFSPAYLTRSLEASLRRLNTDYVDLFQLHSPPAEVIERGDWEPALARLKRAGKVRYYGIACDTPEAALAALRFPGVSSIQVTLSLLDQSPLVEVLPTALKRGVAVIARECLANGLLVKSANEIGDLTKFCGSPAEAERKTAELAEYRQAAKDRGVPLARLALEFAGRTEGVSVALVGARSPQQLRGLLDDLGY
jgi:aryl-alcohol dehydrogenase-like predicted oxidoreductase